MNEITIVIVWDYYPTLNEHKLKTTYKGLEKIFIGKYTVGVWHVKPKKSK